MQLITIAILCDNIWHNDNDIQYFAYCVVVKCNILY